MSKTNQNAITEMFQRRERGACPFCDKDTTDAEFRDDKSRKEYKQSGLCQGCQDSFYEEVPK